MWLPSRLHSHLVSRFHRLYTRTTAVCIRPSTIRTLDATVLLIEGDDERATEYAASIDDCTVAVASDVETFFDRLDDDLHRPCERPQQRYPNHRTPLRA